MENRRKHARFRTAIAAEIELDGELHTGTTRDVSQGGVSVMTDARLTEGGSVMLTLILTEDGIESVHAEALSTRATVMWAAPTDGGAIMAGLRFEGLGTSGVRTLAHLLSSLASASHPPPNPERGPV